MNTIELTESQFESLKFAIGVNIPIQNLTMQISDCRGFLEHFLGQEYEQIKDKDFVNFVCNKK